MNIQIRRVGILQAAKVFGVVYAFFGVLMLLFGLLILIGGGPNPGSTFLMAVLYPVMGFVGGMIGAAIYNQAAKLVGGITLEFDGNIVYEKTEELNICRENKR